MLWIIVVGLVAGILARLLSSAPNKPTGFLLTIALGIAGAFVATFIGQAVGWYRPDQGAGFIAATLAPSWCCSSGTGLPLRGAYRDSRLRLGPGTTGMSGRIMWRPGAAALLTTDPSCDSCLNSAHSSRPG